MAKLRDIVHEIEIKEAVSRCAVPGGGVGVNGAGMIGASDIVIVKLCCDGIRAVRQPIGKHHIEGLDVPLCIDAKLMRAANGGAGFRFLVANRAVRDGLPVQKQDEAAG